MRASPEVAHATSHHYRLADARSALCRAVSDAARKSFKRALRSRTSTPAVHGPESLYWTVAGQIHRWVNIGKMATSPALGSNNIRHGTPDLIEAAGLEDQSIDTTTPLPHWTVPIDPSQKAKCADESRTLITTPNTA